MREMLLSVGIINFGRFLPDAMAYSAGRNDPPPLVPMPKPELGRSETCFPAPKRWSSRRPPSI